MIELNQKVNYTEVMDLNLNNETLKAPVKMQGLAAVGRVKHMGIW